MHAIRNDFMRLASNVPRALCNFAVFAAILITFSNQTAAEFSKRKVKIWIFTTHLTGAVNQRLGVAQQVTDDIEVLNLPERGSQVSVHDYMLAHLGSRISESQAWPDFIIHTEDWKHEADFLLELRAQSPKSTKLIYLDNPRYRVDEIDLVVNAVHVPLARGPNIIRTVGVPSHVTPELIEKAKSEWSTRLAWLKPPVILVGLGGDSLHNFYRSEFAADLATRLKLVLAKTGGSLLIAGSRRTPPEALNQLLSQLRGVLLQSFNWNQDDPTDNHYVAGLALADFVVASGDSRSMLSDVVAMGKPLYIHAPYGSILPEHARLIEELYVSGRARPFTGRTLESFTYPKIDIATQIADEIRLRFLCEEELSGKEML